MLQCFAVGVLIVVHNRKADLLRLLSSVFHSDYKIFDVLVLDDSSNEDLSEIVQKFPLSYIRLEENVGFVAGMTKGLRHLMQQNKYKYLWVLDSDLEVSPDALRHLVAACSENDNIGVAGCVIYNTHCRNVIVETGADVNLRTGVVTARNCNVTNPFLEKCIEVDFIASGGGGSMFNIQALQAAGLHDERYYFLWEDTDYGLLLKTLGYRTVVITDAVIYHPPFTEKRNPNIYAYYGVRNPLLTVARHATQIQLPYFVFCNLFRYIRIALLMSFSGVRGFLTLTVKAIVDFISGRFGKAVLVEIVAPALVKCNINLTSENMIYIIGTGSLDTVKAAFLAITQLTTAKMVLVVQDYRVQLFENVGFDSIITYNDHVVFPLLTYIRTGMTIFTKGGCLINTDTKVTSPLLYFGNCVYNWNYPDGCFSKSGLGFFAIWQPIAAVIIGLLLSLILLPFVYISALLHRRVKPVIP